MPLGRRQIQIFAVSAHYHRTGCTYGNEIRYHMEMKLGIQAHHNHTCIKVEFFSGIVENCSSYTCSPLTFKISNYLQFLCMYIWGFVNIYKNNSCKARQHSESLKTIWNRYCSLTHLLWWWIYEPIILKLTAEYHTTSHFFEIVNYPNPFDYFFLLLIILMIDVRLV